MAEALYVQEGESINWTADAAYSAGEVIQMPDGRAGVVSVDVASGGIVGVYVRGVFKVTKTASMVFLPGGRAFWDHSANASHYKKVNDRDFYLGRYTEEAASAATVAYVALNVDPPADIDALGGEGGVLSVATGTAAAGGFGLPVVYGKSRALRLTATSEVQCVDMLSVDKFAVGSNWIAEFVVRLGTNGSTSDVDFDIGVASGTSTSDAGAIAESCFFHIDGGALDLFASSDDGTTEVNETDTTVNVTAASAVSDRFECWLDGRDTSNVKFYVNGAEVLSATANLGNIALAAGPLGLLAILEKSTGTATAGPIYIDRMEARYSQI
jgi:predicted RecA/RadA family phage recombinase